MERYVKARKSMQQVRKGKAKVKDIKTE